MDKRTDLGSNVRTDIHCDLLKIHNLIILKMPPSCFSCLVYICLGGGPGVRALTPSSAQDYSQPHNIHRNRHGRADFINLEFSKAILESKKYFLGYLTHIYVPL